MDDDRKQQLLNNLIDKLIEQNMDDWRWNGDKWLTSMSMHIVAVPGSYLGRPKIGIDTAWIEPDVKKNCTRNVKKLRTLRHKLKAHLEVETQARVEKALLELEEV